MQNIPRGGKRNSHITISLITVVLAFLYFIWAGIFIFQSSFIAFDGKRYFALRDDAMVSMRYAWNLSHGIGLVWAKGVYVEGYTNPLMTLYMAIATGLFDKPIAVLFIQITRVVFVLGIAYLSMKITRIVFRLSGLPKSDVFGVIIFGLVLAYYPLSFWTLLGM